MLLLWHGVGSAGSAGGLYFVERVSPTATKDEELLPFLFFRRRRLRIKSARTTGGKQMRMP